MTFEAYTAARRRLDDLTAQLWAVRQMGWNARPRRGKVDLCGAPTNLMAEIAALRRELKPWHVHYAEPNYDRAR